MAEVPGATRIVVAASTNGGHDGFGVDDVAWLLRNAEGEVLVIRPTRRRARRPPQRQRIRCSPAAPLRERVIVGRAHPAA